jgi:hypothetical protein
MPSRPESSASSAIESPLPSAPMRWSAGITTSSKLIVVVCEPLRPILCSGGDDVRPGVSAGTWKHEMPRAPSSDVRASTV